MVTVLGGGIAGTASAGALAGSGRPVTVYEQRRGEGGGAFLILDGRGHRGLIELGVPEQELHAASYPLDELRYTPDDGVTRRRPSEGHRFWLRGDLMAVLNRYAFESGAEIRYGDPVTEVRVDPAVGTVLRIGGRTVTTRDLVIGADGIDSVARAGIEPHRSTEYAGDVVVYGMTEHAVHCPTTPSVLHFDAAAGSSSRPAATVGHIWRPGTAAALWFLRITRAPLPDAETGVRPVGEWAEAVVTAAPGPVRELTAELVAATGRVHVSNARNVPLGPALPPASPVVLVGDADHAITPAAGVGAREGIEDVVAVYRAITAGESPAEAMSERRRAITQERDRVARRMRSTAAAG
ncbi:FAD-dependent oxidoreductase [Nocardia flavorosea]|uniref:FAD-dependent monooxygenase n=1 Tax=Nocardia flavorosea TaxID=53429 RepID=A0A846YFU4_9NOCA|nr:NAD(P)/FAD-dependent oxidoreductase [Nocardia flavorosea]NKY57863.1 FAD-dependent monooxygenase [Nocardia flavorosea]